MLKRQFRLRSRKDFNHLYRQGRIAHAVFFSIKYHQNKSEHNRAAVIVSTKISKKAVIRNRIRRRLYGQLENVWGDLTPGYDMAVLVRQDISKEPIEEIRRQLVGGLRRAGIIPADKPVKTTK